MIKKQTYILTYSGGKDSTAALLYMIKEKKIKPFVVFSDTGNESPDTYNYIEYISDLLQSWGHDPVVKLKGEYTFLTLAKKKQRFPSIKARFCTEWLKIVPFLRWLETKEFDNPIICTGIRKQESFSRSTRKEWEQSKIYGRSCWNPIIDWSVEQVFEIHKKYKTEINPMYKKGFSRVGCFPCINATRNNLLLLKKHYPNRLDEIERWEEEIGSTYFAPRKDNLIWKIKDQIKWATKGNLELFPEANLCKYRGLGICE